jgi:hypothetical protein
MPVSLISLAFLIITRGCVISAKTVSTCSYVHPGAICAKSPPALTPLPSVGVISRACIKAFN